MTTRKDDDLSRETGHDKTARPMSYDEAHAEAKQAAREAAAAHSEWHLATLAYMNAFSATLRKHGWD